MKSFRPAIICIMFFALILIIPILFFIFPDRDISLSERRRLQQAPNMTAHSVFSGKWQSDLEAYAPDQFPMRDSMRAIKAAANFAVLGRLDNNGLFSLEGSLCKLDYPLNESQVLLGTKKLNEIKNKYLSGSRCWFSVIPDKGYFAGDGSIPYPAMDYLRLRSLLEENIEDMEYIHLFPSLSLSDYYLTDAHWQQHRLQPVTDSLAAAMGFTHPMLSDYEENTLAGFSGVYAGQWALPVSDEDMIYLTDSSTQSAVVYDWEEKAEFPVYRPEKFTGTDPYDLYLGGARALLEITTGAGTGRELLLFRDSFGSSLAPLLLHAYDKVTLIDLRYIPASRLPEYISFHGQDALFLYSAPVWNNSSMLRS